MRLLLLLLALLLTAGCVPPSQEQLRMEMDLAEMKRRLAQVEIQQADKKAGETASGDSLQRQVAEVTAGLDNLRVEFQSVNGRLDDLSRQNQQQVDEIQLIKDDLGLQLDNLNNRLDLLEQSTQNLASQAAAAPVAASAAKKPAAAKPVQVTPEQVYQQALDLIRKENRFAEGREQLEKFVKDHPDHELTVNAIYWSGEALYGEKQYELAILRLQDVISKYPAHSKAPAAMYKQALAFNALGDSANAKTTMQKLIADYPNAEQLDAAKKFLAE